MDIQNWYDYVKASYDLVTESTEKYSLKLEQEVEAYVVHMLARNFNNVGIGSEPIATKILTAMSHQNRFMFRDIGDECLIIYSYPFRRQKWPSENYYADMGILGYGMSGTEFMEKSFMDASRVLQAMFAVSPIGKLS